MKNIGDSKKKKICSLDVEDKHKSLHRIRNYINENGVVCKLIHMGSQVLRTTLTGTGVSKEQKKKYRALTQELCVRKYFLS